MGKNNSVLTAEQRDALIKINEQLDIENKTIAKAEEKARADVKRARVEAAQATNVLVSDAVNRLGISKTIVAAVGLGTPSRNGVYLRLEAAGAAPEIVERALQITAEQNDDSTVSVHLDHFYHGDLGNDIVGSVVFDEDGKVTEFILVIAGEEVNDIDGELGALWSLTLWGLPEVQAAL